MERPRPTASGSSRRMMSCLWLNHSPTTGISKICIFSMKISCYRSYTSISQSTWLITDQPLQFCSAFDVVFDLCWPLFMSRRGSHAATQKGKCTRYALPLSCAPSVVAKRLHALPSFSAFQLLVVVSISVRGTYPKSYFIYKLEGATFLQSLWG